MHVQDQFARYQQRSNEPQQYHIQLTTYKVTKGIDVTNYNGQCLHRKFSCYSSTYMLCGVYVRYTHTQQIYLPAATLTPFQHDSTEVGSFHFQGLANYS